MTVDTSPHGRKHSLPIRMGIYASILMTAGIILSGPPGTIIVYSTAPQPAGWQGIEIYAESFRPIQMFPFAAGFLLLIGFVLFTAVLHHLKKSVRTLSGIAFALLYGAIISVNYFLQLAVVGPNMLAGNYTGMEILVMANPGSVFWALEMLGYGFQGLSLLFIYPIFRRAKLENVIRWLVIVNGIAGVVSPVIHTLNPSWVQQTWGLVAYLGWNLTFTAMAIAFIFFFRGYTPLPEG